MSTQATTGPKGKRGRKRMNGEEELPPEEQAKKQKNREAAKKCREKKLKEAQELKSKNDELEKENDGLKKRKEQLENQVSEYENVIKNHMAKGCKLPQPFDSILSSLPMSIQDSGDTDMFLPVGTRVVQEETSPSANEFSSQENSAPSPLAMFSGTPLVRNNCHSPAPAQSQFPTSVLAHLVSAGIDLTGPLAPITTSTQSTSISVSTSSPFTMTLTNDLYPQANLSPAQQVPNIDKSIDAADSDDSDSSVTKGNGYAPSPLSIDDPVTELMYKCHQTQTSHDGSLRSTGFTVSQGESMQTEEDAPSSSQLNVSTSELLTQALLTFPTSEMTEEFRQQMVSIASNSERSLSSSLSSCSVHEEAIGEQATNNNSEPPYQQNIPQRNSRNQEQRKYQQLDQQQQHQQQLLLQQQQQHLKRQQQQQHQIQTPFANLPDSGVTNQHHNRSASQTEIVPTEALGNEQDISTEVNIPPFIQGQAVSSATSEYVLMLHNNETSSRSLLAQPDALLELENDSIHQVDVENQSSYVYPQGLVQSVLAEPHTLPTVVTQDALDEGSIQVQVGPEPVSPHQQPGVPGHSSHMNLHQEQVKEDSISLQHIIFSTEDGRQIPLSSLQALGLIKPAALPQPQPVSSPMPSSAETLSSTARIPTTVLQAEAAEDTSVSSGQLKHEMGFKTNRSLPSLDYSATVSSLPSLGFNDLRSERNVFDKSRRTLDS